jgi:two-component sensor histidine kinase
LSVDQLQTLGFIIHELVSNSLKHAWYTPNKRKISIALSEKGQKIQLDYSDNGRGIPDGIDPEKKEFFGLRMIHSFVERQLRGKIILGENPDPQFRIEFKREEG